MTSAPPPGSAHASTATDDAPPFRYTAQLADRIERAWQERWAKDGRYRVANPGEPGFDASKPKFYCLDMFPYPSGAGLHVGHPEGYTATDILCRYKRMAGFNVLHPMGWDAFGLPAEQYAIQTGVHPAVTTGQSIETFRRQLQRFGFCYDWSREVGTIDPGYYRWTQWIFLQLYDAWFDAARQKARPIRELIAELESGAREVRMNPHAAEISDAEKARELGRGAGAWSALDARARRAVIDSYRLAYQGTTTVNWCPKLGTVLANDEVIDGKSERGGYPVLRKPLKQWMFRITAYADRLLAQLDGLQWPESTKTMQREWIGRSEGAEIGFSLSTPGAAPLTVFTTRPDTLFGATYMVVAPEHPLCARVVAGEIGVDAPTRKALGDYVAWAKNRSDVERQQESKTKTGVFTGVQAINPATGQSIPVWTADYVLMGYGTGAIMAVPAHDERDCEFALAFGLPMLEVVRQTSSTDSQLQGLFALPLMRDACSVAQAKALERQHPTDISSVRYSDHRVAGGPRDPDTSVRGFACTHLAAAMRVATHAFGQSWFIGGWRERITAFAGHGIAVNSAGPTLDINGLPTAEAKKKVIAWLEAGGIGRARVNYKFRDWTFSRQRYWGEPFPIVFDDAGNHYPVGARALPVTLPELADYAPVESDDPQPLLAKARQWCRTTAGEAGVDPALLAPETPVTRETNTMPGSAGSSWYFLRYCDPANTGACIDKAVDAYWMNVDFYIGGSEHAVGHLLYSRFWQSALHDLGHVSKPEPFQRLFHQGMITSFAYERADGGLVAVDQVDEAGEGVYTERATGEPVKQIIAKMSKSLKNVVNPDDVIEAYGADTFRLYEMAMGPLEASKPWNTKDIVGPFRFLQRLWRNCVDETTGALRVSDAAPSPALLRMTHRTIAGVTADIEAIALHTGISKLIELNNELTKEVAATGGAPRAVLDVLVRLLAPYAPHLAEELWQRLGQAGSVVDAPWPRADASLLVDAEVEVPVQVAGKIKARVMVPTGADSATTERLALADGAVQASLAGKTVKKVIVVPGKLVNIVAV